MPSLRRYATALVGRTSEADDLVQDCIERALRRPEALQQTEKMGAWLRAILHNLHIDAIRRRQARGVAVELRDMQDDISLSTPHEDRTGIQDFVQATMSLSLEHRQILTLVGVEGLSYREVAEELGVPMGTVMSRLARAREKLREALDNGRGDIVVPFVQPSDERKRTGR